MEALQSCASIASRSLRSNYRQAEAGGEPRTFIVAGPRVYQQVWTRDFCYAAGGALLLKDFEAVSGSLETFMSFQRADGLFPKALSPKPPYVMTALEYLGFRFSFKAPLKPYYTSEQFVVSYDSNALLAFTAARYVAASGDKGFAERHLAALARALAWYDGALKEGLVEQPPFSDWQDAVGRRGRVFYTNLVYWKGLESMAGLAEQASKTQEAAAWRRRADDFRTKAQSFFWDEDRGIYKNADTVDMLDTSANCMAVVWGFADSAASERILKAMETPGVWRNLGPRATFPDYPDAIKSPYARFAGFNDYHDRQVWSWGTAAAAWAYARLGRIERGQELLRPMAEVIARDGVVGEVYDDAGQVKRWLARSESPFSWGSGIWLEALNELGVSAG